MSRSLVLTVSIVMEYEYGIWNMEYGIWNSFFPSIYNPVPYGGIASLKGFKRRWGRCCFLRDKIFFFSITHERVFAMKMFHLILFILLSFILFRLLNLQVHLSSLVLHDNVSPNYVKHVFICMFIKHKFLTFSAFHALS